MPNPTIEISLAEARILSGLLSAVRDLGYFAELMDDDRGEQNLQNMRSFSKRIIDAFPGGKWSKSGLAAFAEDKTNAEEAVSLAKKLNLSMPELRKALMVEDDEVPSAGLEDLIDHLEKQEHEGYAYVALLDYERKLTTGV